jgi:penicillin-binding protein 1A
MVNGYSMLCNGGKQVKATFIDRIQDRYGRTVWRHDTRDCSNCAAREWSNQKEPVLVDDRKQILDPMSAFQMTSIMEGVVQTGTAQRLKALGRPIAGKTGTTNDYKDAWFVGFTPDLAVGAYIGYDQPTSMGHGETGGTLVAPIIRDFLKEALKDVPPVPFRAPPGIKLVRVNHKTGQPAGPGDKSAIMEAFKPGQEPAGSTVEPEPDSEGAVAGDDYGAPPPPMGGPGPGAAPGDDRALTSGTGGLY